MKSTNQASIEFKSEGVVSGGDSLLQPDDPKLVGRKLESFQDLNLKK